MAKLSTKQKFIALETRGRIGRPSTFGRAHCGFNLLGADDSLFGTYQKARFATGREISLRPFYWPTNPQSVAQQANRGKFSAGVVAYRALTTDQLIDINKAGQSRGLTGYNYFLSKYLRTH